MIDVKSLYYLTFNALPPTPALHLPPPTFPQRSFTFTNNLPLFEFRVPNLQSLLIFILIPTLQPTIIHVPVHDHPSTFRIPNSEFTTFLQLQLKRTLIRRGDSPP